MLVAHSHKWTAHDEIVIRILRSWSNTHTHTLSTLQRNKNIKNRVHYFDTYLNHPPAEIFRRIEQWESKKKWFDWMNQICSTILLLKSRKKILDIYGMVDFMQQSSKWGLRCGMKRKKEASVIQHYHASCVEIVQSSAFSKRLVQRIARELFYKCIIRQRLSAHRKKRNKMELSLTATIQTNL